MNERAQELMGWGRWPRAEVRAVRPERLSALPGLVRETAAAGATLIAHGGGRSYGDAALNRASGEAGEGRAGASAGASAKDSDSRPGRVLFTERLDRLHALELPTGDDGGDDGGAPLLVAEPGVTIGNLARTLVPKGFLPPVSPGTGYATLGGAVAMDVHGKNHDHAGSLGDHVDWIELVLASGEIVRASRDERPDLFHATIGGLGLTGLIRRVGLRLKRVTSGTVTVRERHIPNLDAFLDALFAGRENTTYSVGWLDAIASGRHLGRGILETAEPSDRWIDLAPDGGPAPLPPRKVRKVPVDLPDQTLNTLTMGLFNRLWRWRVPPGGRIRVVPIDRLFYPLDALGDWNRVYGRRGFHQFQCVIPDDQARAGLRSVLETSQAAGSPSYLAVIKTLGRDGIGMLSFARRGVTLTLDFPHGPGSAHLFANLERIVLDHGGRVYLAKDALTTRGGLRAMYPRLAEFEAVLRSVDPNGLFASDMARRLGIGQFNPAAREQAAQSA